MALAGVEPAAEARWPVVYERIPGLAELAWAARRLNDEQVARVLSGRRS